MYHPKGRKICYNKIMSKKQIIFIATSILLTLISFIFFVPWSVVLARLAPKPDSIEALLEQSTEGKLDGAIVYVHKKGQEPEYYAGGWKDRDLEIPADPHSLFKIASITKLYVAASVAKLAAEGTLDLDRSLAEYLPSLKDRIAYADQITLRMLVQHRSGIPDYIDDPEFHWFENFDDLEGHLELALDKDALFNPDHRYNYSNTNYLLIGRILDNVLGYSYTQYIDENFLDPLGLDNTFHELSEIDLDRLSSGYMTDYCCDVKEADYRGPTGSMIATAEDVGHFVEALNDGSLFSDEEQAIYSALYEYGHTGLLPGYSSIARYHDAEEAVVVLFVNTSGGETWGLVKVLYNRVCRLVL